MSNNEQRLHRFWAPWSPNHGVLKNPDYYDPKCECGGGNFLGIFRTIRMYENHKLIECILYPKKLPVPYLTPSYFNALQIFESITSDISNGTTSYQAAVIDLIKTWNHCSSVMSHDPWTGTHVFMHYAVGESTALILDPAWESISDDIKCDLSAILRQILYKLHLMKNHVEAIHSCRFLLSVLKNPWNHHYLPKLLFENPTQEDVANFIQYEKCNIFVLRLNILCHDNCEAEALKLSSLAMDLHNYESPTIHQFDQGDFESIRDIYYACLEWSNNKTELIKHLKTFSFKSDGKLLLDKYCDKIESLLSIKKERRPRIFKSIVAVIEMAAYIMVVSSFENPCIEMESFEIMSKWSNLMLLLMESGLESNMKSFRLKDMIKNFMDMAPTAKHIYVLCDILHDEFGSRLPRTLYIELYIKALASNINEKENYKQLRNSRGSYESLKLLVQGYLKLANLLEDILSVCRECVLTAYSLMPSSDLMVRVESLAIKSGKLVPENNVNLPEIFNIQNIKKEYIHQPSCSNEPVREMIDGCDTSLKTKLIDVNPNDSYSKVHYDLSNLPEPLSPAKQDDLIAVLKYPRFVLFSWDLEWPEIKKICQKYLNNLEIILKRNVLFSSDFKYINIDIKKYNESRKMELKLLTNDKGYFTSDAEYTESDDEDSSISSKESACFSTKTSNKVNVPKENANLTNKSKPKQCEIKFDKEPIIELTKLNLKSKIIIEATNISINNNNNNVLIDNSLIKNEFEINVRNTKIDVEPDTTALVPISNLNTNVKDNKEDDNSSTKVLPPPSPPPIIQRERRKISKNQREDFDYSWKRKGNSNKNNKSSPNKSVECESSSKKPLNNDKHTDMTSKNSHLTSNKNFEFPHSSNQHLNMLSERIPQLSSLDFIVPANINHVVNVVQIQVTSNTLTNVSQAQTERVSNRHSNNETEKKTNDSQTDTHSLDNFVSVYQSNSVNSSINSIQNSGILQGECSITGSVSLSNQRIATDSSTNVNRINQEELNKPASIVTHDVLLNQNQITLEHQHWNDIQLQNTGERLQSTIENTIHLSSNVIVRTSEVTSPSHVTLSAGQIMTSTTKKPTYCVKTRDRFIDLSLPTSISSMLANSNRSTNMAAANKSNFEQKPQQSSPVQTSVGLQVNFNNQQSKCTQNISPSSQASHICTNIVENSISSNMLNDHNNIINTVNSNRINTSTGNTSFDNLKSNISIVNPVSSIQTQTCVSLQPLNEESNSNAAVMSLMITSTQNQVIKSNVYNSLYTSPQNQRIQLTDVSHTSQTSRSEEQKKIDNLKLISQTFTATSEAIKFVTSNTESQRLIQSTDKSITTNLSIFQNDTESLSNASQENGSNSKSLNRGRGNTKTYESKTRALKQANMSDMFVFEKGTLYAVQDDVMNQVEPTKSITPSRNNITTNIRVQNKQCKESLEKPKPSPNITITGSMLPRFQQVFGKTKFPSSTVINDTLSLCSTNISSIPSSSPGLIVNRPNTSTSRVYSSSKGVQTNHDIDPISSNTINFLSPKILENKLQHNMNITKANNIITIGNNKNNVIMACKTVSSIKNVPHISATSSNNHQLFASNTDTNIVKKELAGGMPISKVSAVFTTSCSNSLITSSNSNVIYSIPIQTDSKTNNNVEKHIQSVTQVQRQLKVSPSIIQSVLRKHPTWQQNCFRQNKQSTEVQTLSTVERLISTNISNIVKTTESSNNKVLINSSKPNAAEPNVSSSMMEQVREFESVLEEVRKTSLMNEMSTVNILPQINHEIIQIHSPTENVDLLNADSNQSLFSLNKKSNINNDEDRCSFSFLNQTLSGDEKEPVNAPPTIISVRSVTPTSSVTSTNNSNASISPVDGSTQCSKQIANKTKPVIKTPASSPSNSAVKVPVLQKPLPKLQEDEQTTQRIYAILDKYAEQLRNSPELKNKPAPRRRTNPPTNPSLNTKRKKSNQLNLKTCSQQTSCSSSGMEMSPTSDMQAIDSEDSSNAVSNFSHITNSPSRNSDDQTTTTVISESPLIENTLINVNDVIKKINVDAEIKSKVSQSTQIVVSGTSGPFLSIAENSATNVRFLVASGKSQKMYRLHCPVTGPGPVVFHQIATKDSCTNDVKISSIQNINESTILSALTTDDLQVSNTGLGNEILLTKTSQNSTNFEHKINKSDIILESMEKAQVLEDNEKPLQFPVMKKSQASQSTFSVIHSIPSKPNSDSVDNNIELLSETQNNVSENIQKNYCDNEQSSLNIKRELPIDSNINRVVNHQEKFSNALKEEPSFVVPGSSESNAFEEIKFPSFHSLKEVKHNTNNENASNVHEKNNQQNITNSEENKFENKNTNQISVDCVNDSEISNDSNNLNKVDNRHDKKEELSNVTIDVTSNKLHFSNSNKEDEDKNNPNMSLNNMASVSTAEIISTVNQSSNTYKQKDELSTKNIKTDCESENENENTLSNTVYNMLDNQSTTIMNTKIGSLIVRLKNDRSAKNWNSCLSKIMPPGTFEKLMEGEENLKQLQESFQHAKIKTFKDLKIFVFEQCKNFDNNVETPKEYDLYDDIDGLGVDKPSTNELFPEVAILNDLDKSVSPTLGLLQASTSKSNDAITLQSKRKSVLSHTTSTGVEQTPSVVCKKSKTKVSFLKQALYNEMNQDSNDCETKLFVNGSTKTILDAIEQIDSSPESPLNTTAVDSETCMSEDSTSTMSSGTPHYNFRKSKRKNIEEDGFIESQVIKRMYRGRTSEDSEEKSELPKNNNTKVQTTEQKPTAEQKESNRRISSRLKNNVKNNQHVSNKSPQIDNNPPHKVTATRSSLRRVVRKST